MNNQPRYIVKFRTGRLGYYQQHETKDLLIQCNENWEHIHLTGWTANQLKSMRYVKRLSLIATQTGRFQTTEPNHSNTPKSN